ncbi:hypothetical protein BDN67DRAFT_992252 [Paxillus ammoniavirescens]|nr:hypothetical protein BDN67DRAFT_992252 [Paxillus ammoniavirescens]
MDQHSHHLPENSYNYCLHLQPGRQNQTTWVPECSAFLDELIRLEGRRDYAAGTTCPQCEQGLPEYRCDDCDSLELFCTNCIVNLHKRSPFHRIKYWNQRHFKRVTLKSLGLHIQLGHAIDDLCCNPKRAFADEFVVMDTNGIHEVGLDFCECGTVQTHIKQLLRAHLFPATVTDPKTAATFCMLEQFQLLSFESKASSYKYYQCLSRLSDNVGINPPKDHYAVFLCVVHEWRHLKMLKSKGQCAVLCPVCPQPGKNLPDGWMDVSEEKHWLYIMFIGIDANFCLRRKHVSNNEVDPGLSKGWAYFVEEKAYKDHLAKHKDKTQECSTCSSHNAVNMADTKKSHGLAATGVGTFDWDLQKGEKYINMDYLFLSTMRNREVLVLNISYDIACQWHKNLWTCMDNLPDAYYMDYKKMTITFLVLKFHLPTHVTHCQITFSFNLTRYVGRTDGEAPERGWANINLVTLSTKEMGPGTWRDTLDDHFGDWNWKQVQQLGQITLRKVMEEKSAFAEHNQELDDFEACIDRTMLAQWMREVEAWEKDPSQPNPYETRVATVWLELARAEVVELEAGNNNSLHPDISPSILISSGLEIEDQQWLGTIQQCSNALRRCINAWQEVQLLYMPFVVRLCANNNSEAEGFAKVKETKLWLPSDIGSQDCCQVANTRAPQPSVGLTTRSITALHWGLVLQPLKEEHIKAMKDLFEKETKGRKRLSWIWKTPGVASNNSSEGNEDLHDSLCTEWCKARARKLHWEEEVELLDEEQWCILVFLNWQASWWLEQVDLCPFIESMLKEGLWAYTHCQVSLRCQLGSHFEGLWAKLNSKKKTGKTAT